MNSSDCISPTRKWRREICLHRSPTTPAPFLTSSFAPAVVFFSPSRTVDLPPWHSPTWLQAWNRWRRILQGSEIVALTAFNDMYLCSLLLIQDPHDHLCKTRGFHRPKVWILCFGWCLAVCAGAANVIAFKQWNVYASHVTGSTTAIAFRLVSYTYFSDFWRRSVFLFVRKWCHSYNFDVFFLVFNSSWVFVWVYPRSYNDLFVQCFFLVGNFHIKFEQPISPNLRKDINRASGE